MLAETWSKVDSMLRKSSHEQLRSRTGRFQPTAVCSHLCKRHLPGSQSPVRKRWKHLTVEPASARFSDSRHHLRASCRTATSVRVYAAAAAGTLPPEGAKNSTLLRVVIPTALVLLLCNIDRICMSVAILPLAKEMGWAASTQGIVQSAFLWGYTITQIAGGTLADKYGGRIVIACAVAWFSAASFLLPAAVSPQVVAAGWALPAVLLARAAVGFGEGVVLPAMSNLMATRVPTSWRTSALGIVYSGFHTGNPTGLLLSPLIMSAFGWRAIFYAFGAVGLPLVLAWLAAVPRPQQSGLKTFSRQPSAPDKDSSSAASSKRVLSPLDLMSKPATWAIIIVNTINHWGYFIYLSWMPSYFYKTHGLDLRASSLSALVPWLALAICSSAGGLVADRLAARGWPIVTVRKRLQSIAFLVPAAMLLVLARPQVPASLAITCMAIALGATSLSQFVANMSDIAPSYAGQLFGLCNTFGCLAAILGVSGVGFVFEMTGSLNAVFKLTAGLYVVAVIAWNCLCSGDIREREVEDIFYKYGRVRNIDLKTPPRPPAYAFVEFDDPRDASDAVRGRDGYDFGGYRLRVELSRGSAGGPRGGPPPVPSTLVGRGTGFRATIRNLPQSASWQDLKDHFRKVVKPAYTNVYRDRGGLIGVVEFENQEDLDLAIRKLDDTEFRNPFEKAYIRIRDESDHRQRGGRSRSRSRSRARSYSRSRSPRSRSPASRSPSRSRSAGDKLVRDISQGECMAESSAGATAGLLHEYGKLARLPATLQTGLGADPEQGSLECIAVVESFRRRPFCGAISSSHAGSKPLVSTSKRSRSVCRP
ncbi:hypothetical protein WJX73_002419 [Symbiochloris irregularis]|uniref:Uncharacterized protein n=1 Tax=Symbiochloris irregularis TaxID=706552 RepID=A0AAW1PL84_9CHLO